VKVPACEGVLGQRGLGTSYIGRQVSGGLSLQAAQQHVGQGNGMGLRFQFLAEGNQHGRGLALSGVTIDVVHRVGEEAAGLAGGIIEGADQARVVAEERVVGIQQQRCSEVDHIARGHEVFGRLIDLGTEAADQVLVYVGHDPIRDYIGMQVRVGKVLAYFEQNICAGQATDCVGEVELVEDDAGVVREIGDVGLKVGLRLCRA
jgi:hypothetical protein